jgi:hypothetical protein
MRLAPLYLVSVSLQDLRPNGAKAKRNNGGGLDAEEHMTGGQCYGGCRQRLGWVAASVHADG